jgi:hypothetical protein
MTKLMPVLAAAALASAVSPAFAAPAGADVKAAFGNTLMTIDPDGRSRKIWLSPDGTWSGLSRRGLDLAGKWTTKGEEICLSQSKPKLPGRMCGRFPTKPGVTLQAKDPMGKTVRLRMAKGHVTR